MLKYKLNKSECVSKTLTLNIKSIIKEDDKVLFESKEPLLIKDNETVYFVRKFKDNIIYKTYINIEKKDKHSFYVNKFKDKELTIEKCEEVKNISNPFSDKTLNALRFTVKELYKRTNRDVTIRYAYSKTPLENIFRCCSGDYVRYDGIFLLKAKSVKDNKYETFEDGFLNTYTTLYFKSGSNTITLNALIPLDYNGNDSTTTFYWFFEDGDLKKDFILENYKEIILFENDNRYLIEEEEISFTKDFDGEVDSFIEYEKNDLELNINIKEGYNTTLLQNDYYKHFYVDNQIKNNINKVVDMEKQIFIPKVKNVDNGEINTNGIVNEIIFNPIFRKRSEGINNWGDWEVLNEYTQNLVNNTTSLYDLGFTNDDIKYQKKSLKKSFLRLTFYDTKNRANQSLLFYSTIFFNTNKLFKDFITYGDSKYVETKFNVKNSFDYSNSSEGYYLYLFPNLCKGTTETTIYMKVEFNHAKYGKTLPLLSPSIPDFEKGYIDSNNSSPADIKKLFNDLYIEVKIKYNKDTNEYIWYLNDDKFNDSNGNNLILNLYEPIVNKI
jgi:hypothetical protein